MMISIYFWRCHNRYLHSWWESWSISCFHYFLYWFWWKKHLYRQRIWKSIYALSSLSLLFDIHTHECISFCLLHHLWFSRFRDTSVALRLSRNMMNNIMYCICGLRIDALNLLETESPRKETVWTERDDDCSCIPLYDSRFIGIIIIDRKNIINISFGRQERKGGSLLFLRF